MADIEILNPDGVAAPVGTYSHVARAPVGARIVAIAGQVGIRPDGTVLGTDDFEGQCAQAYANVEAALRGVGGTWANVLATMTFLTRREDMPSLRAWRERRFPELFPDGRYPPNTLLVVHALASDEFLIEIQALAAV